MEATCIVRPGENRPGHSAVRHTVRFRGRPGEPCSLLGLRILGAPSGIPATGNAPPDSGRHHRKRGGHEMVPEMAENGLFALYQGFALFPAAAIGRLCNPDPPSTPARDRQSPRPPPPVPPTRNRDCGRRKGDQAQDSGLSTSVKFRHRPAMPGIPHLCTAAIFQDGYLTAGMNCRRRCAVVRRPDAVTFSSGPTGCLAGNRHQGGPPAARQHRRTPPSPRPCLPAPAKEWPRRNRPARNRDHPESPP